MPKLPFPLVLVARELDNGSRLIEPLLLPELATLGRDFESVHRQILAHVTRLLRKGAPESLAARRIDRPWHVETVPIRLDPPRHCNGWETPVELPVSCVVWSRGSELVGATVPMLDIDVVARDLRELKEQLPKQIHAALLRQQATTSLRPLALLDRTIALHLRPGRLWLNLPTTKQQILTKIGEADTETSVLKQVATDLARVPPRVAFEVDEFVRPVAEALTARLPRSVLLIGPSGVGKTALVYELFRRRAEWQLANTPFWTTSGSRLIAGASGFGMWQERCQNLIREASRTKAVLHVGPLFELFEVGKGGGSQQGIAAFLRASIQRGELLLIAECTAEELPALEREDPALLAAFHHVRIAEPESDRARTILLEVSATLRQNKSEPKQPPVLLDPGALEQIDSLHRRFATYSAYPGRPLRFLKNLLEDHPPDQPITATDVTRSFSRETGLPLFMLDHSAPLRAPDGLRPSEWFERRILGQPDAVQLIADLLATIKAGLTRPGKPIASLLFIGPTGVGKTEMAKSLCEFLYQDASRMVRVDMSEYADPLGPARLIAGTHATAGLLTSRVRQQPFTVVLLDELEKAHPLCFDLLLQVLGEGRLTDSAGRLADFRNCVVIMTSNLGADSFGRGIGGFNADAGVASSAALHFEKQVREFFRPELFNRLDRIVPFAPLSAAAIRQIAEREVTAIAARDGLRYRPVELELAPDISQRLAEAGYHPRYGARPLNRAIQRQLVVPLANTLNEYPSGARLQLQVHDDARGIRVDAQVLPAVSRAIEATTQRLALERIVALRRQVDAVERSPVVLRISNEIVRLEQQRRQRERLERRRGKRFSAAMSSELRELRQLQTRLTEAATAARRMEEDSLMAWHRQQPVDAAGLVAEEQLLRSALHDVLRDLFLRESGAANMATVALFAERTSHVLALARIYEDWAVRHGLAVGRYHVTPYRPEFDPNAAPRSRGRTKPRADAPHHLTDPSMRLKNRKESELDSQEPIVDVFAIMDAHQFYEVPTEGMIGALLSLRGQAAFALLVGEAGLHEFRSGSQFSSCLVEVTSTLPISYDPPKNIHRRGAIPPAPKRRVYREDTRVIEDLRLQATVLWDRSLSTVVAELLERFVNEQAWKGLDS